MQKPYLMEFLIIKKKYIKKNEIKNILKTSNADVFALLGAGDIGQEIKKLKQEFISL